MKKQLQRPNPNNPGDALSAPPSLPQLALGRTPRSHAVATNRSPGERSAGPFADPGSPDQTEILLQGLIAECHAMIREQVRPGYDACQDPLRRDYFVSSAVSLTNAAMRMGKAIARLRGVQPSQPELRQRITVERIQRLSPPGEGEG